MLFIEPASKFLQQGTLLTVGEVKMVGRNGDLAIRNFTIGYEDKRNPQTLEFQLMGPAATDGAITALQREDEVEVEFSLRGKAATPKPGSDKLAWTTLAAHSITRL